MKKTILSLSVASLMLVACGGDNNHAEAENETENQEKACTYSYDAGETVLTWTAFKHVSRNGVSGTFDEINVEANNGAGDMFEVLEGATFNIPVESINSQDPTRDPKLINHFFGVMNETMEINGEITSLNKKAGKVKILMNGVTRLYDGEVKTNGENITFLTNIDMKDFDAEYAIDSLHAVCKEKHTGEDGISILWTDVELAVKTKLVKTCE